MNPHQATHIQHVRLFFLLLLHCLLICPSGFPQISPFSFTLAAPSTATVSLASTLVPECPGNQVKLDSSAGCGCPSGMVKDGDNCTCPAGFTVEGAGGCKGEKGQS